LILNEFLVLKGDLMENILRQYLDSRLSKEMTADKNGPVLTISREYGCPSKILADMLVQRINDPGPGLNKPDKPWRWIGKELLEQSAMLLRVKPEAISHVYKYEERSLVEDILAATRKDGSYRSDRAIRNSIGKVIRSFGESGHVILVGRGGVAVTRQIPLSLHVRLIAPLEWRISRISESAKISREEAIITIGIQDENRKKFLEFFLGHEFGIHDFDAVFNCGTLKLEEIVESILSLMRARKLI
jgi:cytidylate kinase